VDWTSHGKPGTLDEEIRYITERVGKYELMIAARYWLAQGQPRKAIAALTEWIPRLREMKRRILLIEAYLLRGLAFQQAGDQLAAIADMTAAIRLAAPDDFVRVFIDEGVPTRELLAETLKHIDQDPEMVQYIRSLLVLIPTAQGEPVLGIAQATTELTETLSRRESEVLEMLVLGLSTREIADRMVVSVHTVRSHLKSIYTKLGVHNRYAAVEKARAWARML
jgi:LuxR family maltose regulon positive regulatory protein